MPLLFGLFPPQRAEEAGEDPGEEAGEGSEHAECSWGLVLLRVSGRARCSEAIDPGNPSTHWRKFLTR
jgi:hypothetical protein